MFLAFSSKGAFAAGQSCCSDGYSYVNDGRKCQKAGFGDISKYQCDLNMEQCQSGVCSAKTKKPDCPPGTFEPPLGLTAISDLCCTTIQNCMTPRTKNCSGDGKAVYVFKNGVCAAEKKTPIFLCLADQSCETAIGNITTDPAGFVTSILKFVVGISGGVALLMMIFAGYTILTSTGDPQKLAGAKEMIVSVVSGIVLIVFSMVLLNAIGVDILGLPGLK